MDNSTPWPRDHVLATDRLELRAIAASDTDELGAVLERDRDYLRPGVTVPQAPAETWIEERVARLVGHFEAQTRSCFVVRDRTARELIGTVTVTPTAHGMTLSYWVAAPHARRGYAREAVGAVCEHLLAADQTLIIQCHAPNVRSANVARALGFVRASRDEIDTWELTPRRHRAWTTTLASAVRVGEVRATEDNATMQLSCEGARVTVEFAELLGEPLLVVTAVIGDARMFSSWDCLVHNDTLAVGSLAARDDHLVLRTTCRPHEVTPATFALLGREATRLARTTEHHSNAYEAIAYLAL